MDVLRYTVSVLASGLFMVAPTHSLDLQGHRGARGLMPENTLPAFVKALAIGVTTLELDCAITKDGVVVVSHDSTLNPDITRGPDGKWVTRGDLPIASLTYDELQRFDVGRIDPHSPYAQRFPQQEPIDHTRMPRLADVFALTREAGNHTVRFNIETKISPLHPERTVSPEAFARAFIQLIQKEEMAGRTTIQSFDWRTLTVVQSEAPEIATVYLTAQQRFMDNILAAENESAWMPGFHVSRFGGSIPRMVKAAGGTVWSPYYEELTPDDLKTAHALGLKVVVWTVNSEAAIGRMIDLGVDGLISDYPDLLRKVAGEKNIALPPPTAIVR